MTKIDLSDLYPYLSKTIEVEVPEEILEVLNEFRKAEEAYEAKIRYHKAYFSLDCDDGST